MTTSKADDNCKHAWERMGYSMLRCKNCGEGESAVNLALEMQAEIARLKEKVKTLTDVNISDTTIIATQAMRINRLEEDGNASAADRLREWWTQTNHRGLAGMLEEDLEELVSSMERQEDNSNE